MGRQWFIIAACELLRRVAHARTVSAAPGVAIARQRGQQPLRRPEPFGNQSSRQCKRTVFELTSMLTAKAMR